MTTTASPPQEQHGSLAEKAYTVLRDRLVTLEIRPTAAIDDDALAASLAMGRTPVREALKRLEGDRLVVTFPRRGTFATGVDITDLAHISEIRVRLEPLAARHAALRATADERGDLRSLSEGLAAMDLASTGSTELMRHDMRVHRSIYAVAGNPHLQDVLVRYHNLATRIFCLFLDRLSDVDEHVHEHVDLLDAIAAGDAEAAESLARTHVSGFEKAVRAVI